MRNLKNKLDAFLHCCEKITIVAEDFGRKCRRRCQLLIYGAVERVVCLNY